MASVIWRSFVAGGIVYSCRSWRRLTLSGKSTIKIPDLSPATWLRTTRNFTGNLDVIVRRDLRPRSQLWVSVDADRAEWHGQENLLGQAGSTAASRRCCYRHDCPATFRG